MIIETVLIDLPQGTTRNDVMALYEKTAAHWATNPDLIEKYYYFDPATGEGGGVYIWPNRAAAEKWHGADYRRMIADVYGAEPRIRIFDALSRTSRNQEGYAIIPWGAGNWRGDQQFSL